MKLSVPHIDKSDISSVNSVLKSEWISTSSKIVKKFEDKLSNFCNTKYSIALNSGTSAIHLGLKVLGVDNNSEVIVPSLTFIATVNPVLYLGATPIIFDVDQYHNLKRYYESPERIPIGLNERGSLDFFFSGGASKIIGFEITKEEFFKE